MAHVHGSVWYNKSDLDYWGRTYGWAGKQSDGEVEKRAGHKKKYSWRRNPKSKWTPRTLTDALDRWCADHHRRVGPELKSMKFSELGNAVLVRSANAGGAQFSSSAENVVFELDYEKLEALTTEVPLYSGPGTTGSTSKKPATCKNEKHSRTFKG